MKTKLTIVIALLNEADRLVNLHSSVSDAVAAIPETDLELILVDDGSTDTSWSVIRDLCRKDSRVRGLRLSKNFGNHAALQAGLRVATGDLAMNLAADLQTPLELIPRFLEARCQGANIVFGARRRRGDSFFYRCCARTFYAAVNLLTPRKMPAGGIDVFLLSRAVVEELRKLPGRNASILSLIAGLGFTQRVIEYDRPPVPHRRSRWTLRKKAGLFADGIFAAGNASLRPCFPAALLLFALGILGLLGSLVVGGTTVSLAALVSIALILVAVQVLGIALLGEYLFRVLQDVALHPLFVVREDTGTLTEA